MRVLHTADWHLGKVFEQSQVNFSLLGEQEKILEKIIKIADEERVDIVVIAGDIFDSYNPPNEARRLYNRTILELSRKGERPVIIISGNHDSPEGLAAIKPLSEEFGIFIQHLPGAEIIQHQGYKSKYFTAQSKENWLNIQLPTGESATFYLLPYVSESRLNEIFTGDSLLDKAISYNEKLESLISKSSPFEQDHLILVSHIFVDRGTLGGSEKTLILGSSYTFETSRIPEQFSLVLLGHLHRVQQINEKIFYSGSIFPMNVREVEASPAKYVTVLDLHNGGFESQLMEILPKDYVRIEKFETITDALENLKEPEGLIFIEISKPLNDHTSLSEVLKRLKSKLLGITFGSPLDMEDEYFSEIKPEELSDKELFVEFYKKQMAKEPDEDLIKLYLEILNEVRNETG